MGTYLNPGNAGFRLILNDEYVDKTGLIGLINGTIDTPRMLTCISRPRRFGKSYAAQMLCAYYDQSCDSGELFHGLQISDMETYLRHLNQYHVIYLDMSNLLGNVPPQELVGFIREAVTEEILSGFSDVSRGATFDETLIHLVETTRKKIVMIIDEWDAPIREVPEIEMDYLRFLRTLFKSSGTTAKIFSAAYMTGILPIKKDKSQSAVSDFKEYTILNPGEFTPYTGFTEKETKCLCQKYGLDFGQMKAWYDGYEFEGYGSIYNPFSVMETVRSGEYESHWKKTSAAENLITYVNLNRDGLQEDILKLLAGERIFVNTRGFQNDFENFQSKDDIITLLIHLGYLSYDKKEKDVGIPNVEVRLEFVDLMANPKQATLVRLIRNSEKLLKDTLAGNAQEVAASIERVRETNYAPQYYNDEQALRYVLKFAYIVCLDRFWKVEELPSGRGLADIVFLPKRNTAYPAMLIELKWDLSAAGAIEQMKERRYPTALKGYVGEIVLVGINYDMKTKRHECVIERIDG